MRVLAMAFGSLLMAAWAALAVFTTQADAERRSRTEDTLRSVANLAQSSAIAQEGFWIQREVADKLLESVASSSTLVQRAFLITPTSRGWKVLADTASSSDTLLLPTQVQAEKMRASKLPLVTDSPAGRGEVLVYVPLHAASGGQGILGLTAGPSPAGERFFTLFSPLIGLSGAAALMTLIFLVWSKRRSQRIALPDGFLAAAEVTLALIILWSGYQAIDAQSRLHRSSVTQASHVKLVEAISRSMAVIDLQANLPPVMEAAEALRQTDRPWLSQSFIEGMRRSDQESLLTLLAHQSVVTSDQLHRAREVIATASQTAWQNFALVISASFGLLLIVQSRKGRERSLLSKAEEGEATRAHLDRLVDHMPIGLGAFSGTKLEDCNPAWQNLLGPTGGASESDWSKWIHPSDLPKVLKALSAPLEERMMGAEPLHCRILCPSGVTRHLGLRLSLPLSESSLKGRRLVFALDISDEIHAREALERQTELTDRKNSLLAAALDDLEDNIESVVHCLVKAVEAKDPYTAGHSERVAEYCLRIGRYLGLGPFELRVLELGALVHDVGKIGIPDEILLKPSSLTKEEFSIIKTHPAVGEEILSSFPLFQECMPIVRWHHERLDGSGYPDRLMGEDIPFLVRISSVADAFDAMTSSRAYREGMGATRAFEILQSDVEAGKLDPLILEALRRTTEERGVIPQVEASSSNLKAA